MIVATVTHSIVKYVSWSGETKRRKISDSKRNQYASPNALAMATISSSISVRIKRKGAVLVRTLGAGGISVSGGPGEGAGLDRRSSVLSGAVEVVGPWPLLWPFPLPFPCPFVPCLPGAGTAGGSTGACTPGAPTTLGRLPLPSLPAVLDELSIVMRPGRVCYVTLLRSVDRKAFCSRASVPRAPMPNVITALIRPL